MATMKDVARRAGVSTATVSRVINNTAYVEPVTRERVEKAMREFNYHRNAAALALAKKRQYAGIADRQPRRSIFSRGAGRGRHHAAGRRAVDVVQRRASGRAGKKRPRFSHQRGCEAIVAHVTRMGRRLLRYAAHTPALVLINRYLPAIANRCIWLDNANAAQTATELLIRRGIGELPA